MILTLICQGPSFYLKCLIQKGHNSKKLSELFALLCNCTLSWWISIPSLVLIPLILLHKSFCTTTKLRKRRWRLWRSCHHNTSTFVFEIGELIKTCFSLWQTQGDFIAPDIIISVNRSRGDNPHERDIIYCIIIKSRNNVQTQKNISLVSTYVF